MTFVLVALGLIWGISSLLVLSGFVADTAQTIWTRRRHRQARHVRVSV